AKERLTPSSRKLALDWNGEALAVPVADYYAACAPLVDRTLDTMAPLLRRLDDDGERADGAGLFAGGGASGRPPGGGGRAAGGVGPPVALPVRRRGDRARHRGRRRGRVRPGRALRAPLRRVPRGARRARGRVRRDLRPRRRAGRRAARADVPRGAQPGA